MIIFGSRCYGKTDQVDGVFYVVTKFAHIYFVPLIPMESILVFGEDEDGYRGASISLAGKSILIAWLRVFSFLGMIILGVGQFAAEGSTFLPLVGAMACLGLWLMSLLMKPFTHASYERALHLADSADLGPQLRPVLDEAFGMTGSAPISGGGLEWRPKL